MQSGDYTQDPEKPFCERSGKPLRHPKSSATAKI
jgi:hypothetical protein